MTQTENQKPDSAGEVLKQIGKLENATENLNIVTQHECKKANPEEVASWITVIGKAILSLLPK